MMTQAAPLAALAADVAAHGVELDDDAWRRVRARLSTFEADKKTVIFRQTDIADHWLFLTRGVAASEQTAADGSTSIARFFEPGQICANLTSVWRQELVADDLVAITKVTGVLLPDDVFRGEFLHGDAFGEYLRRKAMASLLFSKELICAKTSTSTEIRYRFLEERHLSVLDLTSQKDVARFLGVTPQGLSRFLKSRNAARG